MPPITPRGSCAASRPCMWNRERYLPSILVAMPANIQASIAATASMALESRIGLPAFLIDGSASFGTGALDQLRQFHQRLGPAPRGSFAPGRGTRRGAARTARCPPRHLGRRPETAVAGVEGGECSAAVVEKFAVERR